MALRDKLPKRLFFFLKRQYVRFELALQFFSDWRRFSRYSFNSDVFKSDESLVFMITMTYHSLEKGLSHTNLRLGFGQSMIKELMELLDVYIKRKLDLKHVAFVAAIDALNVYADIHEESGYSISQPMKWLGKNSLRIKKEHVLGGYNWRSKQDVLDRIRGDYQEFVYARHSVREFDPEMEVDVESIRRSIELANRVPSACNRQSSKAYIIKDRKYWPTIKQYLNGCRTFADDTPCFIAITSDYQAFDKHSERNACYIDGGIFAHGVLQALTYEGLATCILNTSMPLRHMNRLKASLAIPKSENLIAFIAVGHYKEKFKANCSARLPVDNIIQYRV